MVLLLLDYCKSQQITLTGLARWTGIARVSLSRYAHGTQDISLGQLMKIASCLGCRVSDLVDDREDLNSSFWKKAIRRQASRRARDSDASWVPRALLAARQARQAASHEKA